jgi:hypothetical protein
MWNKKSRGVMSSPGDEERPLDFCEPPVIARHVLLALVTFFIIRSKIRLIGNIGYPDMSSSVSLLASLNSICQIHIEPDSSEQDGRQNE